MYLCTHSYFSLRYGTLSLEELIALAKKYSIDAMAITDINNSTATLDFVRLAIKNGIKPIAGIEFRNGSTYLYTALAQNNDGFYEINHWRSTHNIEKKELPETAPDFKNVFVVYPFDTDQKYELKAHEFIGIGIADLPRLITSPLKNKLNKLVVAQAVTYQQKGGFEIHRHLRAIDTNSLLSQLDEKELAGKNEYLMYPAQLKQLFENYPTIIHNTEKIVRNCSFVFTFKTNKNLATFTESKEGDIKLLHRLTEEGFRYRYPHADKTIRQRLSKELKFIKELGFASYFLIGWDIVRYAIENNIYHVGRGSGANSLVSYCLKITDVDPIELNLYFERFINPKRSSPPDFDIDFSWKERDKIYDYIFSEYGTSHAALLGAMVTFQGKSVVRELGKVYGLPKKEIDTMANYYNQPEKLDGISRKILDIGAILTRFPNIRSIHAGGIIISDKPLNYYTAFDMPPKGYQTTQWDMYAAETIGFEKLDILSQRGIGHINECKEMVEKNRNISIDIHDIENFKTDKKIKQRLKNGETIGCFYIESPAMRGLLKKLRCNNYNGLVAASSIIRPGVAKSGMMKEYIRRFHNPNGFSYIHPVMKEQLSETFGIMVYQEDVLKICHHFAGLDLSDADVLRRLMSGKPRYKDELKQITDKFYANCRSRGYAENVINEVWRQISSFAGYSFSKAHSASYAVESFQSLFLKTYYPHEFMAAVINNFGGYYSTWVYFNEARRLGANIELPCVNMGNYKTAVFGTNIYIGFVHIMNVEKQYTKLFIKEREQNGFYRNLADFLHRNPAKTEQISILIRLGAFRFTGKSKATLLWEAHAYMPKKKQSKVYQESLFSMPVKQFKIPDFEQNKLEDAYDEIELLEFPVTLTFFDMLKSSFRGDIFARDLENNIGNEARMVGILAHRKQVCTSNGNLMYFGCFIDATGNFFDTTHFPTSLKYYPFQGHGIYLLFGKVVTDFGHASVEVQKMAKLPIKADPRSE